MNEEPNRKSTLNDRGLYCNVSNEEAEAEEYASHKWKLMQMRLSASVISTLRKLWGECECKGQTMEGDDAMHVSDSNPGMSTTTHS